MHIRYNVHLVKKEFTVIVWGVLDHKTSCMYDFWREHI